MVAESSQLTVCHLFSFFLISDVLVARTGDRQTGYVRVWVALSIIYLSRLLRDLHIKGDAPFLIGVIYLSIRA
jgi:hypothetical protein